MTQIEETIERLVSREILTNCSHMIAELSSKDEYIDEIVDFSYRASVDEEGEEVDIEALEFWIVTDWMSNQLEQSGELVGEFLGLRIWGRTTSGQMISCDHVMEEIATRINN